MRRQIDYSKYIKDNLGIEIEPKRFVHETLRDLHQTTEYILERDKNDCIEEYLEYIEKEKKKHPYYLPKGKHYNIEYYWDYDDIEEEMIYWVPNGESFDRLLGDEEFKNWGRTKIIDDIL